MGPAISDYMRTLSFVLILFLSAVAASASEIDNAAAAVTGTEASFTQRFTPKGFTRSQVESGSVIFGTLPMMRWTYTKPEEKVFVFDGTNSWFYVAADKQVTVASIDDRRRSELPFLLIGDPAARERLFEVRESGNVITLQPKTASSAIRNVRLTIAPNTHLIQQLEYSDREGNRTVFDFSGYQRRAVTPDLFRFTPPAGVQVVNAQ
ncbi:MAG: outer membrane lipoprotein carrier protein LolA [Acidobacteria bacterium]|nr:MAG: outer membrane lipoprotein carrier protein LolA [Acidobacteriota bacterium]